MISSVTRRNIFDSLAVEGVKWWGRLKEIDFLSRLYNLEAIPSSDYRFESALYDIRQHRINNDDWENNWVFDDYRFELLNGSDDTFLAFICEMLHPIVRPNLEEVQKLRDLLNENLKIDGWELYEKDFIGGRAVFGARLLNTIPNLDQMREAFKLETGYINRQIERMKNAIDNDPDLAIGTAKELIESCCKTILHERNIVLEGKSELPNLIKATLKELQLLPNDIDAAAKGADIIKRLLSNLGTIAQGISELRNFYGTGHGKRGNHRGLHSRHAKLAVGAATTLVLFLFETHQERIQNTSTIVLIPQKAEEAV